jgi:cytochrome P450
MRNRLCNFACTVLLLSYASTLTIILLLQGHDTTSAAVSWALFLLGLHPDVQVTGIDNKKGNN